MKPTDDTINHGFMLGDHIDDLMETDLFEQYNDRFREIFPVPFPLFSKKVVVRSEDDFSIRVFYASSSQGATSICFYVSELPRCCGIAVIHDVFVASTNEKGLRTALDLAVEIAEFYGFGKVIYTTSSSQPRLEKVLDSMGFNRIGDSFENIRTTNFVTIWEKLL